MANPSTAQEPSMEEILASIRQIISEDEGSKGDESVAEAVPPAQSRQAENPAVPRAAAKPRTGATRATSTPELGTPHFETDSQPDSTSSEREPAAAAPARKAPPARPESVPEPAAAPKETGQLLSAGSDKAVSGAFSALAHTILSQNARTLEDLVTDMLRPMLQGWLNENLPTLVERLVKEEIDRVARRR